MRLPIIFFGCVLLLTSCIGRKSIQEELILGEWEFVKETWPTAYAMRLPAYKDGYRFINNGRCEVKRGFFSRNVLDDHQSSKYLGNETSYKIDGDSLMILNLTDKKWEAKKIAGITKDTLTFLVHDSVLITYARLKPPIQALSFDQVIVAASGCYGTCPIDQISIKRNGSVHYYGERYTSAIGIYESQISHLKFDQIATDFNKSNLTVLEEKYAAGWSDDEEITVTLIKNNRIIKTVSDYGNKAPAPLNWAYTPVRYLYQQLNLKRTSPTFALRRVTFAAGNDRYQLPNSTSFYLNLLLSDSKPVLKKIKTSYELKFKGDSTIDKIKTDGRFYRISYIDGKEELLDIGYNFLSENKLLKKFRPKTPYDE